MNESHPVDCEDVMRVLFAYLDGEVDEAQRSTLEQHLARCRSCFSRAEFERRLRVHLADVGRGAVSPELERRIRTLIG